MSNTSINIIYILGTKISLEALSKNLKNGNLPLDGLKLSKEWKQAKIEDPNFEFFFKYDEFVKIYYHLVNSRSWRSLVGKSNQWGN